jgi:lipoate---protein ligase
MIGPMRWIDTGLGAARFNVAMTAGLCALHRAGRIGDTLRFHRYPPSVLIGRHQMLGREVRVEHCRRHQIEVARRVTGGGAVYMSPGILAWDIVAQRRCFAGDLDDIVALICTAMAAGLTPLGLSARFRRSNDVVIEGRKISGCSGSFEGATVLLQGTVLIDVDLAEMTEALILPMPAGKTATLRLLAERLTSLARALGTPPPLADVTHALVAGLSHALGREVKNAAVGGEEITLAERLLADEIGTRSFVEGEGADRPGGPTTCVSAPPQASSKPTCDCVRGLTGASIRYGSPESFWRDPHRRYPTLRPPCAGSRLRRLRHGPRRCWRAAPWRSAAQPKKTLWRCL